MFINLCAYLQVLPFAFDWRNDTGAYQTMIKNCAGVQSTSRCFYKGYSDIYDGTLTPHDLQMYQNSMKPCVNNDASCSGRLLFSTVEKINTVNRHFNSCFILADQLFVFHLLGEGVPSHHLWLVSTMHFKYYSGIFERSHSTRI